VRVGRGFRCIYALTRNDKKWLVIPDMLLSTTNKASLLLM
jgi:hypothetical protein